MDFILDILKTPACITLIATIIAAIVYKVFKINMDFKDIITAIMDEVAKRHNIAKPGDTGLVKKTEVCAEIARKFADPTEKWWSQGKKKLLLSRLGSIPAAVEKAWTIWSAARSIRNFIK